MIKKCAMVNNYYIKPQYAARDHGETFDAGDGEYWTPERVANTTRFQYHVYEACRREVIARGYKSLLELGPGPATKTASLLAPHLERIVLVDQPSIQRLVAQRLPQATFIAANLENPQIELDEQFDVVLCSDVIEHLVDPDPCMRLMRRMLRPGGQAFVSTPERDVVRGLDCVYSPNPVHVREWNREELARYAVSHGFRIRRHELLPQARLSKPELGLSRVLGCCVRTARWSSCQMLVLQ